MFFHLLMFSLSVSLGSFDRKHITGVNVLSSCVCVCIHIYTFKKYTFTHTYIHKYTYTFKKMSLPKQYCIFTANVFRNSKMPACDKYYNDKRE